MTDTSSFSLLWDALRSLMVQLPLILTALAGCIFVVIRWRTLRTAALPALLGLGLWLVLSVIFPVVWAVAPRLLMDSQHSESISTVFMIIGVVSSIFYALALGLLILAVMLGRSQEPPRR